MIPQWRERGNEGLKTLDAHLKNHEFITGHNYSVADIAVFGYTHLADEGGFQLSDFENVSAWIERITSQGGYKSVYELLDGRDFKSNDRAA